MKQFQKTINKSKAYWKHGKHSGSDRVALIYNRLKQDRSRQFKPQMYSSPIEAIRQETKKRKTR